MKSWMLEQKQISRLKLPKHHGLNYRFSLNSYRTIGLNHSKLDFTMDRSDFTREGRHSKHEKTWNPKMGIDHLISLKSLTTMGYSATLAVSLTDPALPPGFSEITLPKHALLYMSINNALVPTLICIYRCIY